MQLDDRFVDQFIHSFYGYGTYNAGFWFVGMEEGRGNNLDEVSRRLEIWQELGGRELVDITNFHFRLNIPEYFTDPVKLQRTWMQQARMVLIAQGKRASLADIKAFQRDKIGRQDQETCLLELLPLPSPSINTWHYDQWSNLPFLKNRETYRQYCFPWRCAHIRAQLLTHQPRVVVFCSFGYKDLWQQIAGPKVLFIEDSGAWVGKTDNTLFLITKHPTTIGIKNAYFEQVGAMIFEHFRES